MHSFVHDAFTENEVTMEGALGVSMAILVDGPHFVMRKFTIKKAGHTPLHKHAWEHEIYVLNGKGTVQLGEERKPLKPGDVVFVESNILHTFTADETFEFLCLIPK